MRGNDAAGAMTRRNGRHSNRRKAQRDARNAGPAVCHVLRYRLFEALASPPLHSVEQVSVFVSECAIPRHIPCDGYRKTAHDGIVR